MVAPLIGITTSVTVDTIPERAYVNGAYITAVQAAGGIPLLLTPHFTPEVQAALWQRLDGLVLTGGGDIEPARFGEARHPAVADVSPARDELELGLTRRALADDVPLFAICRGIQILNVALGGTLVQDIPGEWPDALVHAQKAPRNMGGNQAKKADNPHRTDGNGSHRRPHDQERALEPGRIHTEPLRHRFAHRKRVELLPLWS